MDDWNGEIGSNPVDDSYYESDKKAMDALSAKDLMTIQLHDRERYTVNFEKDTIKVFDSNSIDERLVRQFNKDESWITCFFEEPDKIYLSQKTHSKLLKAIEEENRQPIDKLMKFIKQVEKLVDFRIMPY